ncbi:Fe-S cluster assembly iron-binding protein IscA [Friedmanniella endophytica]|uniref:Fe-S cluster assembly iron-binding protein IscA n=1 Tax=Microlunatus kandeliicorticis TaxID=1759536 RepID=A0A7W3P6D1_9ACTN|nr:Fe-S cluster assembly protein HesB [Microlunatus kandeliicorticis]MBA8794832.1 Fe-S cluster assembly iron-binding protein IscA [Microlunatus kandeliicorticis]
MLDLTEGAATVVNQITEAQLGTADGGLRIDTAGDGNLSVTAVDGAEPADQVVERDGAKVYVAESAAGVLEDKVLDASIGGDGAVSFALGQQA